MPDPLYYPLGIPTIIFLKHYKFIRKFEEGDEDGNTGVSRVGRASTHPAFNHGRPRLGRGEAGGTGPLSFSKPALTMQVW